MAKITTEFLYNRLPHVYRTLDSNRGEPLKRFLEILVEGGFKPLEDKIERFTDLFNPDKCPVEYLPLLSSLLGFEFPYDMPEEVQRRIIKVISKIYRIKGTATAIEYMINEITNFPTKVVNEDTINKTFELDITTPGDGGNFEEVRQKIEYLTNIYKPVGSIVSFVYNLIYSDTLTIEQKSQWLEEIHDIIKETVEEDATSIIIGVVEEVFDTIVFDPVDEIYPGVAMRYTRSRTNFVGNKLNSTFVANQQDWFDVLYKGGVEIDRRSI